MIAILNLAINEQSEKFWYGIEDGVRMGEYEKQSGRMGEYGWWGIGKFLLV